MKTVAAIFEFENFPIQLELKNFSVALDERIRSQDSKGYLGKSMAINEGVPIAVLCAYEDGSTATAQEIIDSVMGLVGQAVVAFGGWGLWDSVRNNCSGWEITKEEMPDFYTQLEQNLNI
ncbi:hypothetical protein [Polynucleobacter yangtzensis]|uniref:hypothetical protein n=1 Tax=Polynucleobacter yangtzensis TaxID=1743159 RepID=UPI000829754D|nr:hypothetical protein [Polynucleobacter yangtzensis]